MLKEVQGQDGKPPSRLDWPIVISCTLGFLLYEIFLWTMWPGAGPGVRFLLGSIPLPVFGWVLFVQPLLALKMKMGLAGVVQMILLFVIIISWGIGMLSWLPMAEIETQALSQPHRPTGQFSQPMEVKGVVRYVTPTQRKVDDLAQWGFSGGFFSAAVGILLLWGLGYSPIPAAPLLPKARFPFS
jgi:hypothetical protein